MAPYPSFPVHQLIWRLFPASLFSSSLPLRTCVETHFVVRACFLCEKHVRPRNVLKNAASHSCQHRTAECSRLLVCTRGFTDSTVPYTVPGTVCCTGDQTCYQVESQVGRVSATLLSGYAKCIAISQQCRSVRSTRLN